MSEWRVHCGDAVEVLAQFPDCHFDAVLTDPSYGLNSITPQMVRDCLAAWLAGDGYDAPGSGFMSRPWDAFVCGPRTWREVLRVLKPGGWLLAFGGTRTHDLLMLALRLAGFEVRDCLMWLHGQGFAGKGANIGKHIDRIKGAEREWYEVPRNGGGDSSDHINQLKGRKSGVKMESAPATSEAARWEGYNTQLCPGWEPIILAQRPRDGTFAANALAWGCGGLAIDACRLGISGGGWNGLGNTHNEAHWRLNNPDGTQRNTGRWPANVLLQHLAPHLCACGGDGDCPDCGGSGVVPGCERVGVRRVKGHKGYPNGPGGTRGNVLEKSIGGWGSDEEEYRVRPIDGYADPDGKETVEAWACAPGCPVAMVGAQSGRSTSSNNGKRFMGHPKFNGTKYASDDYSLTWESGEVAVYADTGTAARYFLNLPPDGARFRYQAKAARRERSNGLDGFYWRRDDDSPAGFVRVNREEWEGLGERQRAVGNIHPTVKPLALCEWLARLVCPPAREEGEEPRRILDPFVGSGSTLLGALEAGWDEATGIDIVREYCDIAEGRLSQWSCEHAAEQLRLARAHRQPGLEGL